MKKAGYALAIVMLAIIASTYSPLQAQQNLGSLSDEFDKDTTKDWKRIYQTEQWPVDHLEKFSLNKEVKGHLRIMPYASCWYQDFRSTLIYKEVTGDFIVTMKVKVSNRAGNGAPGSMFSLAGIMIRTPRKITARTWRPGGENYVFLSIGSADRPGNYQLENKTTRNSRSTLDKHMINYSEGLLRIVRQNRTLVLLSKPLVGGNWRVYKVYSRPDMPRTLQVGICTYTDWPASERAGVQRQNTTRLSGNPDIVADIDYFRFQNLPANMRNVNLGTTPQNQLPGLLGDSIAPPQTHNLKLTSVQKLRLQKIKEDYDKQREALKEEENKQLKRLLTPAQQKEWDNMSQEEREALLD